jgi:hypothetical protein
MAERPANPQRELNLTRIAWLVSIVTPAVLIALLCLAKAASSAITAEDPLAEPADPALIEEDCIEWEEGVLDCEPAEVAAEDGGLPPEECLLRTVRARVVHTSRDRLRLVVHYTTLAPTRAYIDFRMRSGGGSFSLGVVRRHLGRSGTLRLSESLGDDRAARAREARDFLLTIDVPAAPGFCHPYFTHRLSERRTVRGHSVWVESDSSPGAG